MKQPAIEIFYANICGLCTKAIEFMRSRGLDFHAYAVTWDPQADAFEEGWMLSKAFT